MAAHQLSDDFYRERIADKKSNHLALDLYRAQPNRKRPAGEARRFWGYYREERYVSLYMWIRGR
jgi:hypothetical protein